MFLQQFCEMAQVGAFIFGIIETQNIAAYRIRDGTGRFAATIAMDKSSFSFFAVCFDKPVHLSYCASKGNSSPLLVPVCLN